MWCSSGNKADIVWIKDGIKFISQIFWRLPCRLRIYTIQRRSIPCIRKYNDHEGYDYIATYVDDVIIDSNNPSKYMNDIDMHSKVREITESPKYYLGNELVQVGNHIHVSSNKYMNGFLCNYQKVNVDLNKELLNMKINEHPDLDDCTLLNKKE